MTPNTYKELNKAAEGRKNAHDIMLLDVRARMDRLIKEAPQANQEQVSNLMVAAFGKIQALGNGLLFNFFADDTLSDKNFVLYISDILKGKMF